MKTNKQRGRSLKEKIIIAVCSIAITASIATIVTKAAITLNPPMPVGSVSVNGTSSPEPTPNETALTLQQLCDRLNNPAKNLCCSVITQEYPYKSGKYRQVCWCDKCDNKVNAETY